MSKRLTLITNDNTLIHVGPVCADIQRLMGTDVDKIRRQSALFLLREMICEPGSN